MLNQPYPEGKNVWSWFPAAQTSLHAAVPMEPQADQTLIGPVGNIKLGENSGSEAFLSKDALGLRFVPQAQFAFAECSFQKRLVPFLR